MAGLHAAVGKHAVDPEVAGVVAHIVDAAMAEMRQHVGKIQTGHGDFADAHFEERTDCAVNALLTRGRPESGRRREVAAFHDAAAYEDFRMRLTDVMQTARAFQVVVEHAHALQPLRLGHAVEYAVDYLAEVIAILTHPRRSFESQRTLVRLCRLQHLDGPLIAAAGLEILNRRGSLEHLMGV